MDIAPRPEPDRSSDVSGETSWQLKLLERRVDKLEDGKPDVIAERVTVLSRDIDGLRGDLNEEMRSLRSELAWMRRIFVGAFVSVAVTLVIAYVVGGAPTT